MNEFFTHYALHSDIFPLIPLCSCCFQYKPDHRRCRGGAAQPDGGNDRGAEGVRGHEAGQHVWQNVKVSHCYSSVDLYLSATLTGHFKYTLIVPAWTLFASTTTLGVLVYSEICFLSSHQISKVFCWIEIRSLDYSELIFIFQKPVWDYLYLGAWCIVLLKVVIRRLVDCGNTGMDMKSINTEVGCDVDPRFDNTSPQHYTTTQLNCEYMEDGSMLS